jgi:hypothetical protein
VKNSFIVASKKLTVYLFIDAEIHGQFGLKYWIDLTQLTIFTNDLRNRTNYFSIETRLYFE